MGWVPPELLPRPAATKRHYAEGAGDNQLPKTKSAVADFGHFVERPNPRHREVRLGGGRPASAGRGGVTAPQHSLRRRHPTPDCLRQQKDVLCPPPAGEGEGAASRS